MNRRYFLGTVGALAAVPFLPRGTVPGQESAVIGDEFGMRYIVPAMNALFNDIDAKMLDLYKQSVNA